MKYSGTRDRKPLENLPSEWFYSFTSFQARVGLHMLKNVSKLDEIRINNVEKIKSLVAGIKSPSGHKKGRNVYWQFIFYFNDVKKGQGYLHANKVDTSTTSLEYISSLERYPYKGITPNAERLYNTGLFIPSYPRLKNKEVNYSIDVLNSLITFNQKKLIK